MSGGPLWVDDETVSGIPPADATAWIERALEARARGYAQVPRRTAVGGDDGDYLAMPGRIGGDRPVLGAKLVRTHPGGVDGVVVLHMPATGAPRCFLSARALTVLRTAALSLLAARLLAPEGGSRLAVLGLGAQGEGHARALSALPGVRALVLWSRHGARAAGAAVRLTGIVPSGVAVDTAPTAAAAVDGADLIVTATAAAHPLFAAEDAGAARHVTAVGNYRPTWAELPEALVTGAARLVADDREAALAEAGEFALPIAAGRLSEERVEDLAAAWAARDRSRVPSGRLTVFKAVGSALWDLAVADGIAARLGV